IIRLFQQYFTVMMFSKKFILGFILCSAIFAFSLGCKDKTPTSENNPISSTKVDSSSKISGLFEATLPCADCEGIQTRLYLRNDFTYIKEENYKGVSDTMPHIFYDLGKWNLKNDSTIMLSGMTADTMNFKLLPDRSLQMLSEAGTALPDSISAKYRFLAKGNHYQTQKQFLVSGVLDKANKDVSLYICVWNATVEASFSSLAKEQLEKLWSQLKKPESTKAIIQGEALIDANNPNKFILQKINTVIEGDNCN
ncbi:MAG: hypothetical protein DI598_03205, partial [Pseudopedobacter saltans]